MKPLRDMPLTSKFLFGIGIIVVFFWCVLNIFLYIDFKDNIVAQTYQKTDILFSHIQATIEYIRKNIRPKLFHVLPDNAFIPEAMSVSFMNKGIMSEFKKLFPDFEYRRVAINPMNPENRPNNVELEYIVQFRKNKEMIKREIIQRNNKKYFLHARPIIMETECLACHGDPEKAPSTLISLYGTNGGFNRRLGEVIGVESIAIPLDKTFAQVRGLVFSIFITGIVGVVLLFLSVNYYINIVAIRPIKSASRFFKSVVEGKKDLDTGFTPKSHDEIGGLAVSFNQMMEYLRNSQEKLKSSEIKYRRIFEGSKDTIIIADCDGVILDINPAGLELFGCNEKAELIRETSFYNLFLKKKEYDNLFIAMEQKGFIKDYEARLTCIDKKQVEVLITANFRKDEDGTVCGYEALIKDITAWKRVQDKMKEADRIASIGRLAAGLAHEINNPLGIIMGYTGILLKDVEKNDPIRADLEIVSRNVEACKKIVGDLLKFSRKTESKPELINMNKIMDDVLGMLSYKFAERDIQIIKDYQSDIPEMTADIKKMRQVFINLIMNAFQAIDGSGTITIKTIYNVSIDRIVVNISDSGCGISDEIRERIFEPFFTTKEPGEGTGLGLSVSYGIIKEHRGEISVESVEGNGSTFVVHLPLSMESDNEDEVYEV